MKIRVVVNDVMQRGYQYERTEPAGRNFAPHFVPRFTPKELLQLALSGAST